jgi:HEPN domain-containing protein
MDEAKRHEIRQWLIKAEHDLRSARRLLGDTPPLLDTAAYHCQQTAEKALKALLTLHDIPLPKHTCFCRLLNGVRKQIPGLQLSKKRPSP